MWTQCAHCTLLSRFVRFHAARSVPHLFKTVIRKYPIRSHFVLALEIEASGPFPFTGRPAAAHWEDGDGQPHLGRGPLPPNYC